MPDCCSESVKPTIHLTNSVLTLANRVDHLAIRIGIKRSEHRVEPGLYALGKPNENSPVFVSANYTLSFDDLRTALSAINGYILVLDTKGVNVWCAAGKGTFGTAELVKRIKVTALADVVKHRKLIVPQLGATGVSAHEVKKSTGFTVKYGPVIAKDLPKYLETGEATPEMRRIQFGIHERVVLIPVEIVNYSLPMIIAAVLLYFTGGLLASLAAIAAVLAGSALFPLLLPWIPTRDFSSKGYILGAAVALPFAMTVFFSGSGNHWGMMAGYSLALMLVWPSVTAFLSLNFTGSTTFTSKTGVRREINTYAPIMLWSSMAGIILSGVLKLLELFGVV